ncbi:MAG: DUF2085 domain-containing protein [Bacteroidetes bacterium]|nr:DUF2085 domain-containing protein [Bacteroidota bacterium]
MRWSLRGYAVLLFLALAWIAGFLLPSFLHAVGHTDIALIGRLIYSPVCHQDAGRSFMLFDWPLSVCHRCTSIYLSFTAVLLLYPVLKRIRFFHSLALSRLAIFIVPMILDYVFDVLGVWHNSALSRSISGVIAGAGLAVFTVPAWMELWAARDRSISHTHTEAAS